VIAKNLAALSAMGIHLKVDPTHGALWGTVTARQVQRYFGTTLVEESGTIQPSVAPRIPPGLSGITGVVGLTASVPTPLPKEAASAPKVTCPASWPTLASIAQLYGFDNAVARGADGAGTAIDIVSTNRLETAVFTEYNHCAGTALTTDHIDQSHLPDAPPVPGGDETALDTLVLTLLAPKTRLNVMQFDDGTSLVFPLMHLLDTEVRTPHLLDITEVYCENEVEPADLALSEWLLAAYAATGTTTVASAGDTGSSGCYPDNNAPSVTYPASSAFAASVGGADYSGSAHAPQALKVWNEPQQGGGGGGISATIAAPPWQPSGKRQLPDVSAYAVPGGVGWIPVCTTPRNCVWKAEGGTSLTATVLGAAGVLSDKEFAVKGLASRWGNIAGVLWRKATNDAAVRDITTGSNTTYSSACCNSAAGYDTASGWGLFDPDAISASVAKPAK
jgi:subtilase family serine protease